MLQCLVLSGMSHKHIGPWLHAGLPSSGGAQTQEFIFHYKYENNSFLATEQVDFAQQDGNIIKSRTFVENLSPEAFMPQFKT